MIAALGGMVEGVGREAARALAANRLRTCLAAAGIVFGVATVVTALAIARGARVAAVEEIGALGIDNVFLRAAAPAGNRGAARQQAPPLSMADVRSITEALAPAGVVAATRVANAEMVFGTRRARGHLAGVTVSWRSLMKPEVAWGRWLAEGDEHAARRVAVVGAELARDLFSGEVPDSARVFAAGDWFTVVGVLRQRSNAGGGHGAATLDIDRALIVPLPAMDVSTGLGDSVDRVHEIAVRPGAQSEVEAVGRSIAALVARRHGGASSFDLVVPRELLRARLRTERAFHVVLLGIALLALLISGIGIMNIMLAGVVERTQEIGIRRAVGARRSDIVRQFGIESAALCLAGGVTGVPLGALLSAAVAWAGGWPVSVSAGPVLLALLLAIVVGLAFGVYPARRAAAIDPIVALREP